MRSVVGPLPPPGLRRPGHPRRRLGRIRRRPARRPRPGVKLSGRQAAFIGFLAWAVLVVFLDWGLGSFRRPGPPPLTEPIGSPESPPPALLPEPEPEAPRPAARADARGRSLLDLLRARRAPRLRPPRRPTRSPPPRAGPVRSAA